MNFHHTGYLTKNINNSLKDFKELKYKKKGKLIHDKNLLVTIQFISNKNNLVELVKPNKNNYPLIKYLDNKNYAYHFAYKVKNLEKAIKLLVKKNKIIVNPVPAKAFNNKKVAFLKMRDGFIFELVEI